MFSRIFIIAIIVGVVLIVGTIFIVYFKEENPMGETSKQDNAQKQPAYYEYGRTIIVKSFNVDMNGGLFEITNTGTPVDGIVIEIPQGALDKKVTLLVGYNNGRLLNLRSGKESGTVIVLSSDPKIREFEYPVKITIHFDRSISKLVAGYSIDEQGHLHALDIGFLNKDTGIVSFYSFHSLMFTWIYIKD